MLRRDVIRALTAAAALPFVPRGAQAAATLATRLHQELAGGATFRTLAPTQQALVAHLADRIIPRTDTPGAVDVQVPQFIDLLLTEWHDEADTRTFLTDLGDIDARSRSRGAASFLALSDADQLALLRELDAARADQSGAGAAFARLKSMTVYGYFTSKQVHEDVLKVRTSFPRFEGCAPIGA